MTRSRLWGSCSRFMLVAILLGTRANAQDAVVKLAPGDVRDAVDADSTAQTAAAAEASPTPKVKKQKKKKKTSGEVVAAKPAKHPSFTVGHVLKVNVTGRIEGHVRQATPATGLDDAQAEWQDRRIGIQGTALKRIEFEVSRELGQDFQTTSDLSEKTAWRDVYVDTAVNKAFRIEAGLFKLPFGREELRGETNLDFVLRSLPSRALSPGRDPGLMAHGRLFSKRLEYQVGYFTRDGAHARTSQTEGGRDTRVARIAVTPFASSSARVMVPLEVGVAVADSRLDDRLGIRGRSVLADSVFFDRVSVNGRRERIGWETAWALGPVGLSGEYIRTSDERTGMGFSGADLPSVDANGSYIAGTWAVTGERKHGRLEPRRDFLRSGMGAIELAARVETLRFNAATYPTTESGFPALSKLAGNADHVATLGVNWYLNHYARVQANVIRESIEDPERSPAPRTGGRFMSTVIGVQFRM